jgi:5-methylcytosine-specific restriction protein A
MDSIQELRTGIELNNDQLTQIFRCSTQGGMRRSKATNTLVIVANHVKSIYSDRWDEGVFHYTGMGWAGDQSLDFMQNRTLAQSPHNGVAVHLFEVYRAKTYTYVGEVVLFGEPYQEDQDDAENKPRKVWVFPVAPKTGKVPVASLAALQGLAEQKAKEARSLSDEEVAARARRTGRTKVGLRSASVQQHQRSPYVAEHAKRRAKGLCELCKLPAPFADKSGRPYLETHHMVWLARGGADTIENTVALCPNCHKRMHVLESIVDVLALQKGVAK